MTQQGSNDVKSGASALQAVTGYMAAGRTRSGKQYQPPDWWRIWRMTVQMRAMLARPGTITAPPTSPTTSTSLKG